MNFTKEQWIYMFQIMGVRFIILFIVGKAYLMLRVLIVHLGRFHQNLRSQIRQIVLKISNLRH